MGHSPTCSILLLCFCIQVLWGLPELVTGAEKKSVTSLNSPVAQEYEGKAEYNEILYKILTAKAEKFKYYADQFSRRAEVFLSRAKFHRKSSDDLQTEAQQHETKASEFFSKSRSSREKAMELNTIKLDFLNRARNEYMNYAMSKSRSHIAQTRAQSYENEAKHYFSWAANLLRRSEEIQKEAVIQRKHGTESQKKAEKEIADSEAHDREASEHLNKARMYETKANDLALKAKEAFKLYDDFISSSTNEHNTGREKRVRALNEIVVAKVYDQAAMDMKTIAQVQNGEFTELITRSKAASKAAQVYKSAVSEAIDSSRVIQDSVRQRGKIISYTA
ncbi:flagellar attachment zone protein 1-like [Periplaneta americana]|uniref:flagellar attachment zone protein 1-like n=1 Tax=Periplaneta americana TaxID=6978 RepID=UPI0037E96AFE